MGYSRIISAKIIYVKGRQHPVTIYHSAESQVDYVDAAMRTFFQVHIDQPPGDVLIFLPGTSLPHLMNTSIEIITGQEDIESLEKSITFFAKKLPAEKMDVSSDRRSFLMCNSNLPPGSCPYDVRIPILPQQRKSI